MGCFSPNDRTKGLNRDQIREIKIQQTKSLCQIQTEGSNANGFLCRIPNIKNPVLITNNHILGENQIRPGETIEICFTDEKKIKHPKKIKIDETRTTYTIGKLNGEDIDTTIIELKPEEDDLNDQKFIEIDRDLLGEEVQNKYGIREKDIYIINYNGREEINYSIGIIIRLIKKDKSYTLLHTFEIDYESSGSPIILFNHRVIGVQTINDKDFKSATLLKYPISEYCKKLNGKKLINNKITMIYKINKEENNIKILGEEFVKNNKGKCMLLINTQEYDLCESIEFCEYGINENDDLLTIILTEVKTETITNMGHMFDECTLLTSIDFQSFNTQNVINMQYMLYNCHSLTSINFSSFNTENVIDMRFMFFNCSSLTSINLSSFNTKNVTDMRKMFSNCSGLKSLDLESFKTGKVTNMVSMFLNCSSLTSLNLKSFNTDNVESMEWTFRCCTSLTMINLTSFNTNKVRRMECMFFQCSSLSVLDLSSFKTENVIDMHSMFQECRSLTSLDLHRFNIQNVTDMSHMFFKCSSLKTIDLFKINFQGAVDTTCIFDECEALNQEIIEKFKRLKK